jgi:phosphohistidine phosphatase
MQILQVHEVMRKFPLQPASKRQTMRQLLLLRHAKSSWDDPDMADIDRGLSRRGQLAARVMAKAMIKLDLVPEHVLCSPARRTRETWDLIAGELRSPPPAEIVADLYDFGDGSTVLNAIRAHGAAARRLAVVGHNPSLQSLAQRLSAADNGERLKHLKRKFPTCALAVFTFKLDTWAALQPDSGHLTHFIRPRDVQAEAGL